MPKLIIDWKTELPLNVPTPRVTVVITSRNRLEEVTLGVQSCLSQTEPCEVLVYDDASSDRTTEVLQARVGAGVGNIGFRNRGFREALGDNVVSIDDDAFFSRPDTLSRILGSIERFPEAAAFALAYMEPDANRETIQPLAAGTNVRSYVGGADAIDRAAVLGSGGYAEILVHQGEERDVAVRLLEGGNAIVYLSPPPIVHLNSSKRDLHRISFYSDRCTLLLAWMRLTFPACLVRAVVGSVQRLFYRSTWSSVCVRLPVLAAGCCGLFRFRECREPVSRRTYRKFRSLPSRGPAVMSQAENQKYQTLSKAMRIALRESAATFPSAFNEQQPR